MNKDLGVPESGTPNRPMIVDFPISTPIFWGPHQLTRFPDLYNEPVSWKDTDLLSIPKVVRFFTGKGAADVNRLIYLGWCRLRQIQYSIQYPSCFGGSLGAIYYRREAFTSVIEIAAAYSANLTTLQTLDLKTYSAISHFFLTPPFEFLDPTQLTKDTYGWTTYVLGCSRSPPISIQGFQGLAGNDPGPAPTESGATTYSQLFSYAVAHPNTVCTAIAMDRATHFFLHNRIVGGVNINRLGFYVSPTNTGALADPSLITESQIVFVNISGLELQP